MQTCGIPAAEKAGTKEPLSSALTSKQKTDASTPAVATVSSGSTLRAATEVAVWARMSECTVFVKGFSEDLAGNGKPMESKQLKSLSEKVSKPRQV